MRAVKHSDKRERLVNAYPHLDFLWLDTEESEGEVFWITREDLT